MRSTVAKFASRAGVGSRRAYSAGTPDLGEDDFEALPRRSGGADPLVGRGPREIILTEIGGCRDPRPRREGPRNHPHRDRGYRPPRREGPEIGGGANSSGGDRGGADSSGGDRDRGGAPLVGKGAEIIITGPLGRRPRRTTSRPCIGASPSDALDRGQIRITRGRRLPPRPTPPAPPIWVRTISRRSQLGVCGATALARATMG